MGSCKLGTDDGRLPGGTAVVDTNTKIYGTDNMFVVDASIWPGMPSTNPSALIVTASERASELILALPFPKKTGGVVKKGGQCNSNSGGSGGWFGWWNWGGRGTSLTCDGGLTCKAVNYFYSVVRRQGVPRASCQDFVPNLSLPYPTFPLHRLPILPSETRTLLTVNSACERERGREGCIIESLSRDRRRCLRSCN
jgi:GMC oxidoreductase